MYRRDFLIGTAVATTSLAIGSPVIAEPTFSQSPLFNHIFDDVGYMLTLRGEGRLHFTLERATPFDGFPIKTITDAEDYIISKGFQCTVNQFTQGDFVNPKFNAKGIPFSYGLRRQAAMIAVTSRRGWPSGILMHPTMAKTLRESEMEGAWMTAEYSSYGVPPSLGRWTIEGAMQKCGIVYSSSHMPKDEAILFYNGNIYGPNHSLYASPPIIDLLPYDKMNKFDAAAIIIKNGVNHYLVVNDTSNGISNYIRRVKIV